MTEGPTVDQPVEDGPPTTFAVRLDNFEGPFDLLLSLIAKHKLDVTEVALSQVTDEFIAFIRAYGPEWDLNQATHFLVVAATLLDLKAARLLPTGEVEDEEDLAALEARDLLFARLLQYKAYREVSVLFAERIAAEARRFPRAVSMEERFAGLLPEVVLGLGPGDLAELAAQALAPKPTPVVAINHLHQPLVSVREQAAIVVERLQRLRTTTFRALSGDCPSRLHVIARFLALLELYRERVVAFEQLTPLGDLSVRWIGEDGEVVDVGDEFDEQPRLRLVDSPAQAVADSGDADAASPATEGDTDGD